MQMGLIKSLSVRICLLMHQAPSMIYQSHADHIHPGQQATCCSLSWHHESRAADDKVSSTCHKYIVEFARLATSNRTIQSLPLNPGWGIPS